MKMLLLRLFALSLPLILTGSVEAGWTVGLSRDSGANGWASGYETVNINSGNYYAGAFKWKVDSYQSGTPNLMPTNPNLTVYSFCIDIHHTLQSPTSYYVDTLTGAAPTVGVDLAEAINLYKLFEANSAIITGLGISGGTTSAQSAAFQLAVWELLFDDGVTSNATAQGFINNANTFNGSTSHFTLYTMATDNGQDQIGWTYTQGGGVNIPQSTPVSTPAPPALLLALLGVVGMGGVSRLRSRFGR